MSPDELGGIIAHVKAAYDHAYAELGSQIGVSTSSIDGGARVAQVSAQHPGWYEWWTIVAEPAFAAFLGFRGLLDEYTPAEMLAQDRHTNWTGVTSWVGKLASMHATLTGLRDTARRMGMTVSRDAPRPPTRVSGTLPTALLGNALYHSVGDIEDAVKQLAIEYDQAYGDIASQVGVITVGDWTDQSRAHSAEIAKKHPEWLVWWKFAAEPMFKAFVEFRGEMLGGVQTFADAYIAYTNRMKVTSWANEVTIWHVRLLGLRDTAKRMGMTLQSPKPAPLPSTIIEDLEEAARKAKDKLADAGHDVWDLAKFAIYGGLALTGVIAISSVASNLKSGKDPAANYLALASRRK